MAKVRLNLTVDADALARARAYADRRGTSISRLVTDFLARLPGGDAGPDLPPPVRRLLGAGLAPGGEVSGGGGRSAYRRYLEEKYGA